MNKYTTAFLGEIAAQKLGYEPSHVWGKLVDKAEDLAEQKIDDLDTSEPVKETLHMIMRGNINPTTIADSKAYKIVHDSASHVLNSIPESSFIQKKQIQL